MTLTIKANELEAVAIAASREQLRYYVKGVFFEPYADNTTGMIATDGHRLHATHAKREEAVPVGSFIMGNDDIAKVLSMYKAQAKALGRNAAQYLTIEITDKTIAIIYTVKDEPPKTCASFQFTPIDGNFPNWRRVLPTRDCQAEVVGFNGAYMVDFAKACKLVTEQKMPLIAIKNMGASNAILVTFPNNADFLGVLMPMRV